MTKEHREKLEILYVDDTSEIIYCESSQVQDDSLFITISTKKGIFSVIPLWRIKKIMEFILEDEEENEE